MNSHCLDPATGALTNGTFVKTVASGDQLFGTYVGSASVIQPPTPVAIFGITGTLTFTGGTGRFTGAAGTATMSGTEQADFSQTPIATQDELTMVGGISTRRMNHDRFHRSVTQADPRLSRFHSGPHRPVAARGRVARLRENARKFTRLSLDERVQLARAMQAGYLRIARASVEAACAAKGIPLGTPLEGEEWTLGPWFVVRQLRLIRQSLLALKHTGNTPIGQLGRTADQRLAVQVFPAGTIDGMLFQGVRVDVHLQPGVTEEEMDATRAQVLQDARITTAESCWCWAPATSAGFPPWTCSPRCSTRGRCASSR